MTARSNPVSSWELAFFPLHFVKGAFNSHILGKLSVHHIYHILITTGNPPVALSNGVQRRGGRGARQPRAPHAPHAGAALPEPADGEPQQRPLLDELRGPGPGQPVPRSAEDRRADQRDAEEPVVDAGHAEDGQ